MIDLMKKFKGLGYDLMELDDLIYLSAGPDTDVKNDCSEHCEKCSVSCATCGSGCPNGPTK